MFTLPYCTQNDHILCNNKRGHELIRALQVLYSLFIIMFMNILFPVTLMVSFRFCAVKYGIF